MDLCPKTTWSSIPTDIWALIAGKVTAVDDYVRLSAVCQSWYLLATETYYNSELNLVPLHMSVTNHSITLKNPASDATFVLHLPETTDGHKIWGSPFGWLITFDRNNHWVGLLNPFTGATIPLPDLPEPSANWCSRYSPSRVFLTADPYSDPASCLVVMASGRNLVFTRPSWQNNLWSRLRGGLDLAGLARHKGNLYGHEPSRSSRVEVFLFQMNHRIKRRRTVHRVVKVLTLNLNPYQNGDYHTRVDEYLVELNGDLCLCVCYYSGRSGGNTNDIKLFRIDVSTGNLTQVLSLGDHCLFLGSKYAFSYKVACPPASIFEQPRHGCDEFVSNYVFYNYDRGRLAWLRDSDCKRPLHVEVWDMLGSNKVCSITESPNPSCVPFWIIPHIKFPRLKL